MDEKINLKLQKYDVPYRCFKRDEELGIVKKLHQGEEVIISNFWVLPLREVVQHTLQSKLVRLEFEVISDNDERRMVSATYKELSTAEFWRDKIGFSNGLYLAPGGEEGLKQVLIALCDKDLETQNQYFFTGQICEESPKFNFGNRVITGSYLNYDDAKEAVTFLNDTVMKILPIKTRICI